jgi:hypothetical protein
MPGEELGVGVLGEEGGLSISCCGQTVDVGTTTSTSSLESLFSRPWPVIPKSKEGVE